jgi:hypothetical protein
MSALRSQVGRAGQIVRLYSEELARLAGRVLSLSYLPAGVVPPQPPRPSQHEVVCWLPGEDADPAVYCPADTTTLQYVDADGRWTHKDARTGEIIDQCTGPSAEVPFACYLPAADARGNSGSSS